MKKYLAVVAVITVLIPSVAFAKTSLTSNQISAIVGLLQAFGASQSIVNNVEVALGGTTTTTPASTTFTTPSGAVINAANGNVMQFAPVQIQAPTVPTVSNGQQLYTQWSLSSVESGIPQLLSLLSNEQTYFNNLEQESTSCVSEYNSQVVYFQQQGQDALSSAASQSKGLVNTGAITNIKAQTQTQLNDLKNTENSCLASHSTGSFSGQIDQLTSQLNQLQSQVQTNPTSSSVVASILQSYNSLQSQVLGINSSMQSR